MDLINSTSLFFIMLALALIPSASVALVVTRSVTLGLSNGIFVALGIVLGDLVFIFLTILGLSAIAEIMGSLFFAIKYIGALYLIWLGVNLIRLKNTETIEVKSTKSNKSIIASFLAGFFLTLGDIKAIFFYASLFPAFVDLTNLAVLDIGIIISITIFTVGGAKIFYAFSAIHLASLSTNIKVQGGIQKSAGVLMVGTGTYLIAKA